MNTIYHYPIRSSRSIERDFVTPECRMTLAAEILTCVAAPAIGGVLVASNSQTDLGVVIGACFVGAGVSAALGMLVSESLPEYSVPRMQGLRRLIGNWLCGILAVPVSGAVHRKWFPEEDLALVSAGTAAVFAFFGVVVLMMLVPAILRLAKSWLLQKEQTATNPSAQADTVKLVEEKPKSP